MVFCFLVMMEPMNTRTTPGRQPSSHPHNQQPLLQQHYYQPDQNMILHVPQVETYYQKQE